MEIKQTRQLNLCRLIKSFDRNTIAAKCGWGDVNYLNQLVSGHSAMGNNTARKIEMAFPSFGPEHWMDIPPPPKGVKAKVIQALDEFNDEELQQLDFAVEMILSRRDKSAS